MDEAAIDAEMDQIKAHFESIGKRELFMDYITGRDNYTMAKDAAEKHKLDPVESYRRTAGEVEARNVQERMDMTMEERLNSLLSETEDVAEKDKIYLNGLVRGGSAFAIDGKYFRNWQEVLEQFKKDLEGLELNQEQQDIYDVIFQQKDKIRLRINDLNELEDVFVNFGSRKKGIKKFISVHYAGLRNPVTALEVLNIGDVIRRGKITEEGNSDYPTSRRYELQAEDGAMLKVIVDFNRKKDKNRSVINFYSDRESDPRGQASSGGITDLSNNLSQLSDNASGGTGKTSEKINGGTDEYGDSGFRFSVAPDDAVVNTWGKMSTKNTKKQQTP